MTVRFEKLDPKKKEHQDAMRHGCAICDRRRFAVGGAMATAFGFDLPYCMGCIDKLYDAAHSVRVPANCFRRE